MEYMSCPQAAKKWGISERRVQKLCEGSRIPGVSKSAICGLFPKTQKSPLTGGEKKIANRPKNATSYHKETKIGFIVKTQRKIENI